MIGEHRPVKGFPLIDEKTHPRATSHPLSARRRPCKPTSQIGSLMAGAILASIVLAPSPRAWAEHDPAAIWGLVAESHDLEPAGRKGAKIREQKKGRQRQQTRKVPIPTDRKSVV